MHKANLINFGILPLVFADAADYDRVAQGDALSIPDVRTALAAGDLTVADETQGFDFAVGAELNEKEREILLAGGRLNLLRYGGR